ncbi:MAG: leukotoxin LktA family filamentous adhesin [Burkholderiaceae bacterium]|nr:leukotoxin LktA family filamentous adhesin [Burkholderiaceae bacterium]
MTAAAIGYLRRQYICVLRRCAWASGLGMSLMVATPAALGQTPSQTIHVVPDQRTATQVSQQGNLATVTTATTRGSTAFNSFSRFDVAGGQQVNLLLPAGSVNLINSVSGPPSQIDGWVNAYKDGRIGGNVYFFNSAGFVVGASGVLNAGSLTLAAPTPLFMNQLIDVQGNIGDGAVLQALTGTYPLSPGGLVRVQGRLNAADAISLAAGQLTAEGGSRIAAGPGGAAAFASLVNVSGLDSAAGVSTAGGRIRLLGSADIALAGEVYGALSPSGGAAVTAQAGGKISLDGALLSSRDLGPRVGTAAEHESAPSQGPSGGIELAATQIELRNNARLLAQGSAGQAGALLRLSASDDASRATFGSTEDQSARIVISGSTLKGADVQLRATADDKYLFAASQSAQNPTPFQSLENTLLDFFTSLRLFVDVTISKAEAGISVGGGSLLQASSGDIDMRATSRAEARMNVRSTIIGVGYGESTSRASIDIGQASLQAGRDVLLKAQADNTVSVEVGTTNLGNANNNASNPTSYANAAVALGFAEQTATVRSTAASQLTAGRTLSLDAGGAKSFEVASSGGSFQDGMASAGVSVGLNKTLFDARLAGTAQAGAIKVAALLDDGTSSVQAAAGTAGKPQNVGEAVTSARTLDGSFIEGLTGLIAKIPGSDGRSGNKEKFGLSASVAFADIDNRVSAAIAPAAQLTSQGSTTVSARAADTPIFRASAAVDERAHSDPPAGDNQQNNKSVAISGAVVVADMDHVTEATIGDGATVNSAGALDLSAQSRLLPGWEPHAALIRQLREMDWKSPAAYAELGSKLKDVAEKPSQGNTWTQNSVESEKLSLTAAVTYLTLDNAARARIGAAQINTDGAGVTPARDVRVAASAEQGMLHLTGVPEMDATLLTSNSGSGKAGVGGSYLQFVMKGGADASIGSGASLRADDLAVSARTDFDQIMVTETAGKAGKLSINGSFSMLQSELSTVAQIAGGSQVEAGNVLLLAHDDSLIVNIAGGVARSGSIGVGFAVALNEMDRHTEALLGNRLFETASGGSLTASGNLLLDARSAGTQGAFALAGSGPSGSSAEAGKGGDGTKTAGGDTGQQGKSGIGISAAASVNIAGDQTSARVRGLDNISVRGTLPSLIAYASDDEGQTWAFSGLAPGAQLVASNPTLNLAAAGGLSIASGKTAGLAGAFAWNQLEKVTEAGIASTRLSAPAAIASSALNSNASWSVTAGANAGGKVGVAGSVSYSTVDNQTLAQASDAQLSSDGTVRLEATDVSSIRSIAGAASYGGKAGFGAALGLAEVNNRSNADLSGGSVDAGGLELRARSDNEIISVAAALGVSQGIAGSGAVTINLIGNETQAMARQATVQTGAGQVTLAALDDSSILSVAGTVALTTGSASIGIAAAYNEIANSTSAKLVGGSLAGRDLTLDARESSDIEAVAAGGSGAANVGVTGSLGINRIANDTSAEAGGAQLTASRNINLLARDSAELQSVTGAASAAGNAAVGASASYNEVDSEVTARVSGGSLDAADIAVQAQRSATLDVWAIAGTAGGTAGVAGSIAMNLAGGATLARIDGGARVSARNNALLLADADDFIKSRAGAAAVGGTVGAGGAIAFNDITSDTAAELSGAGTLLEGLAENANSAAGVTVPSGALSARSSATQLPSQNPLSTRQQTEQLHGAGVVATSTAGVENFALTVAGGGTAGVAGTVTVSLMGGATRARVDGQARLNRALDQGQASQQGLVAAYHHDQLFSGTGGGAVGGTAGVGGAADTAFISHLTSATLDGAALAGREAARVLSRSSNEITQGVVGLGGGTVGLAGSLGLIMSKGRTETLVNNSQIDSAQGRIDVLATSRGDVDIAAGALAAGAVGVGITATINLSEQQTSARTLDSRLDAPATTTVAADADFTQHVYGATASVAGAVGVAGTVDVLVAKGSTEAEIGAGSRINTQLSAATQDVLLRAEETVRIDNKVGGLGVGVGVGASAAVDVVLLRSGARASVAGGADVRAGRDIRVEAEAGRDIDALSIAGGAGLTAGIAGAVSVVSVGGRPDSDSNDNASGSVAKVGELMRGSSTGNQLGSSGGARAQQARAKADSARAGVDPSGDFAATPTRQSAEAAVASGASLTAGRDIAVDAHTRNDIRTKAVGVALSAGASLGGGFAVALSEERTRAALLGRSRAGRDVRVQALDDQSETASQQAYAGGGGALGLAASLALNRKSANTVAEIGGTVEAAGGVTVDAGVDHGLEAKGLGAAGGLVGIGAAIGLSADSSLADARVAAGSSIKAAGLTVSGHAGSAATTDVLAAAGGLVGAGTGVDADTDNRVRASTTVGSDVSLALGQGSASFSATATPRGSAVARGITVSAGVSMGMSLADVDIASNASVSIGERLRAQAGSLSLRAETQRERIGTGPGNLALYAPSAEAEAKAAAGGLLLGASATEASTTVRPATQVSLGAGHQITLSGGFSAQALSDVDGRSDVSGINGGLLAAGGNLANTQVHSDTQTLIGAGRLTAQTVSLGSDSSDALGAKSASGAGGLGVVLAARVNNVATANTVTRLAGTVDARSVEIAAEHLTRLHGEADSTSASVAGYSGANVFNSSANTTSAELAPDSVVRANAFKLDALSAVAKDSAGADWAVRAASGGVLAGSSGGTLTQIDNITRALVGDGAQISSNDQGGKQAELDIAARNRLDVFDSVLLDTGGAIAVARTESFVDARHNDAQVRIGSGALLKSQRDVRIEASTSGVVDTEAQSKTYGLAGAAEGGTRSRIVTANGITLDGGRIESDENVRLRAGVDNVLRADAETRLWNRTAVPIPSAPDALAIVDQDNRIVIKPYALPAGTPLASEPREAQMQRAAIATVKDIELLAGGGQRELRGFGRGTDLYREALQALGQIFDSDLSLDIQAGAEFDRPASTVQVDGTLFAGTHWRQYLDIGSAGQVLRQSEGISFSTRDNVDLGREIEGRMNALKQLVQTYADNPAVAAGFQADLDLLQARRAQLGVGAKVGFIDLNPAMATSGNIRISGGALTGGSGGELVAPGDASIRVNNASNRFLSVKNQAGTAACPAALCIPGDSGGEITLNGARIASNADINLRNAPGGVAALGLIAERSNSPAPLIELRNTAEGTTPKPEVQVFGNILNPRGLVRIASTGSVQVSSDISAQTVDIATQGDFIKTFSLGYTHTAGDPTLVIKSLTDAEEAASKSRFPAARDPLTATITPLTNSDTVATVARPGGTIIAGNNVFISGEKLNLNGVIQSGIADVRVTIDNAAYADAKNANGAWVPLRNNAMASLDAALRPKLRWNAAAQELELGNIQVEGGFMQLFGDVLSTGGGQLNVLDGYGRIQVENLTDRALVLNRLDTGAGTQGRIRITDTSTRDAAGNNLVTTITRSNGQVQTTQENVAIKDDARPLVSAVASDTSGRSALYTPRANRRLNWINAENIAVAYSQIYTRTCAVSCDFGELADWLAKNAPTQTVVVAPPPVYTPRISGLWLTNGDKRTADYIYDFRKDRYERGGTPEYFLRRYRSGAADFYDNIETRRDWSWKERNFFTHSLAASRPVAINFIGADEGTLSVTSRDAAIKLGDTVRNLKGTTLLDAGRIGLAGGATAGQVIADRLTLTARNGAIGEFGSGGSGSAFRPLEVQLSATGSVELRAGTDIALRAYQGGLRPGRVDTPGRLYLQAEGDIVRGGGATSALAAGDMRLISDNGSIGSLAAPLLINLPADRGGLEARAARDIGIAEATGDLRLAQVASSGGDVLLRAANGGIVDVDTVQSVKQETREALLGVARRAGLTADSGAQAGVELNLQRYEQGKRQEYLAYWQMRGLKERFDSKGLSQGFAASAYDPKFVYVVDAGTAAQLKAANGWNDGQLAAWRDGQTTFYHRAAAEFGKGDARSYDPVWHFDSAAHPALRQALANGGVWNEAQITQRVAAGLFKDTADTQILVENPNVSGRNLQLEARNGIGRASAGTDISRDPRQWSSEQQLALLAADRADLQLTPTGLRITAKDDIDLAMRDTGGSAGALSAKAGDAIYLGSEGDLRLQQVLSTNGEVRIKARGSLTQLSAGSSAVSGRDVLVEAGGGALGAPGTPLQVATQAGGSVTARAAHDLTLAGAQGLVIDQIFTPGTAWLSSPGSLTGRLNSADLNVRAGALTLIAGGSIGLPGDPLAALDVSVTGPLQLQAGSGAWLAASGEALELASARVASGPLRIAAQVPVMRISGAVEALTSIDIDSAGSLTLDPGSALHGAAVHLTAASLQAQATTVQAGDTRLQARSGDLSLDEGSRVETDALNLSASGRLQSLGSLSASGASAVSADGSLLLAGHQALQGATELKAGGAMELRGTGLVGGALRAQAASLRQQGSLELRGQASFNLLGTAQIGGTLMTRGDLALLAGGTLGLDGLLQIGGLANLQAGGDWTLRGMLQAASVQAQAGNDLALGGVMRSSGDADFAAGRDLRTSGLVSAGGSLKAKAVRDLLVQGPMPTAVQGVTLEAGRRKVLPPGKP